MECLTAPPTNRMPVLTRPQLTAPAQLTSGNKQLMNPMGIRSVSRILLHSQCVGSFSFPEAWRIPSVAW